MGLEKFACTGVILAGGLNSRLPGKKKTFHRVGNTTMLEQIHTLFSHLFQEVILVVNDPEDFSQWDMMVTTDIIPARCALAGLHTGLFYASFPWAYVTACDVPFANEQVIRHLWERRSPEYEVIIPRTREGLEPLSALYSKSCIPRVEKSLDDNQFMIKKFFRNKKLREISAEKLEELDPQMRFKFNVNTPEDLILAQSMARNQKE